MAGLKKKILLKMVIDSHLLTLPIEQKKIDSFFNYVPMKIFFSCHITEYYVTTITLLDL
jgi:hypothetical protein